METFLFLAESCLQLQRHKLVLYKPKESKEMQKLISINYAKRYMELALLYSVVYICKYCRVNALFTSTIPKLLSDWLSLPRWDCFRTGLYRSNHIAPCKEIQDSLGFWIPLVIGTPDSLSCITDSKAQDSGFHKKSFPPFRFPLHGAKSQHNTACGPSCPILSRHSRESKGDVRLVYSTVYLVSEWLFL